MAEYSDELKAQVLAALLAGQAPSEVARLYHIPVGTLHSWKSRQRHGESLASLASDSRARIGTLLLEYLETTLTTLKAQQEAFGDKTWLLKQSASEVAALHGTSLTGAVRLLEGLADQDSEMGDDSSA